MIERGNIDNISELLINSKSIIIFGIIGSGKTALAYKLLSFIKNREIYFISHPKPDLIFNKFGYVNLQSINDIESLENCVVVYDEPQLSMNSSDYKKDSVLAKTLSLARQKNILLIILTSDSRLLSPRVESYIETWLIKNCEYNMTKQRSKVRNIIQKNTVISPESFRLKDSEFLFDNVKNNYFNGKYDFGLIPEWNDEISCSYSKKIQEKIEIETQTRETDKTEKEVTNITVKKDKKKDTIFDFKHLTRKWCQNEIQKGNIILDKCNICGSKDRLCIHHKQYTYPFTITDIEILCESCHGKAHKELSNFENSYFKTSVEEKEEDKVIFTKPDKPNIFDDIN